MPGSFLVGCRARARRPGLTCIQLARCLSATELRRCTVSSSLWRWCLQRSVFPTYGCEPGGQALLQKRASRRQREERSRRGGPCSHRLCPFTPSLGMDSERAEQSGSSNDASEDFCSPARYTDPAPQLSREQLKTPTSKVYAARVPEAADASDQRWHAGPYAHLCVALHNPYARRHRAAKVNVFTGKILGN